MKTLVFDTETDGLLPELTKLHCIVAIDVEADEMHFFSPDQLDAGLSLLATADTLVGHNIQGFDLPAIQKVYPGWSPKPGVLIRDTLIMARLMWPEIKVRDLQRRGFPKNLAGKFSLEAFGHRLGEYKGDFKGPWSDYTEAMGTYCQQDGRVTVQLWHKLVAMSWAEESVQLEHDFAAVIRLQEEFGFAFDIEGAERLYAVLSGAREAARQELVDIFGSWWAPDGKDQGRFTPKRDNKRQGYIGGVELTKVKLVEFNPGSRFHIARCLTARHGWQPEVFTADGHPQVTVDTMASLTYPEMPAIMRFLLVQKRIDQVAEGKQAWLKAVKADGRIHGRVNTNGAVTGRCTHSSPNVSQVPSVKKPYGKECRALFGPPAGMVQVGADASGLQLRMLGHYLARYDDGAYAREVIDGDVHTLNMTAAGLLTRDGAKTFIYAYLFGAGDVKIGTVVVEDARTFNLKNPDKPKVDPYAEVRKREGSPEWIAAAKAIAKREKRRAPYIQVCHALLGADLRGRFQDSLPALAALKKDIARVVRAKGYLTGLDGRRISIRSAHSALNALLQSGDIVMKLASVLIYRHLSTAGWVWGKDWAQMAHIHDEIQAAVIPERAEEFGKIATDCIRLAGEQFKLRCPLAGEFKVGRNWSDCH